MEYVMVPVPEELVEDVDRFMKWISSRTSALTGQGDTLVDASKGAYSAAARPARHLMVSVAQATADRIPISVADVAAAVGISPHEAMGMVGEANINFVQLEGRGAMMFPAPNPEPMPEGCPAWAHKVLAMHPDVAQTLLDI